MNRTCLCVKARTQKGYTQKLCGLYVFVYFLLFIKRNNNPIVCCFGGGSARKNVSTMCTFMFVCERATVRAWEYTIGCFCVYGMCVGYGYPLLFISLWAVYCTINHNRRIQLWVYCPYGSANIYHYKTVSEPLLY